MNAGASPFSPIGNNNPLVPVMGNGGNGVNLNFIGDVTFVTHQPLHNPDPSFMMAQRQMQMMQQALDNQSRLLAIGERKMALAFNQMQIEHEKLMLGGRNNQNVEPQLINGPTAEKIVDKEGLPLSVKSKLEAEEVEYTVQTDDQTIRAIKDKTPFSEFEGDTISAIHVDSKNNMTVDSCCNPSEVSLSNTIYRTLDKISDADIIEDLNKQATCKSYPTLFSNRDEDSVVVAFILLDKNKNWRETIKKSIIYYNEHPIQNFFKVDQEYLFFLYDSAKSTKSNCAILVTPCTIDQFLSTDNKYREYNSELCIRACAPFTSNVYRIIEPIIPVASKITELYGRDDFKYSGVKTVPLYSKIPEVEISANLVAKSTILLKVEK